MAKPVALGSFPVTGSASEQRTSPDVTGLEPSRDRGESIAALRHVVEFGVDDIDTARHSGPDEETSWSTRRAVVLISQRVGRLDRLGS